MKHIYLFAISLFLLAASVARGHELLQQCTVTVETGSGHGSGVIFINQNHVFVWTNAHVVSSVKSIDKKIDPKSGKPRYYLTFDEVKVSQEVYENNRQVGQNWRFAEILRFSDKEDLALLLVRSKDFVTKGITFTSKRPKEGQEIWHCGNVSKAPATLMKGTFAKAGRLAWGTTWDHCCLPAYHGCSGGGVFNQRDECIGLLSAFVDGSRDIRTHANMLVAPTSRMFEFSRQTRCEFAMNHKIEVPPLAKIRETGITNEPFDIPLEAKTETSTTK